MEQLFLSGTTALLLLLEFLWLDYAKALDSDDETSGKIALRLMNAYLSKECIDGRQAARNYDSPRWYFFNKFREWVKGDRGE